MVAATKPKPRCPECGSGLTYIRFKIGKHVCRQCGHHWPLETEEQN